MPAHCLRWVDTRNPPAEPVVLTRTEALPENLHPGGVWGDLLESPTEREEMGPPAEWPPPDLERLGTPPDVGLVFPVLRSPAEREAGAVPPARPSGSAAPRVRPTAEERERRTRTEVAPAAPPSKARRVESPPETAAPAEEVAPPPVVERPSTQPVESAARAVVQTPAEPAPEVARTERPVGETR